MENGTADSADCNYGKNGPVVFKQTDKPIAIPARNTPSGISQAIEVLSASQPKVGCTSDDRKDEANMKPATLL